MNKKTTQIEVQNHQLTIHLESKLMRYIKPFGTDEATAILGVFCFIALFTSPLIIGLTLPTLIFNRLIRLFPTDIVINSDSIQNYFKKVKSKKNPYVDFYISMKGTRAKVNINEFKFRLKNIQDISLLTSETARILDLTFENQIQLRNQLEVLTYHKKNIQTVAYKSNLNIESRGNYLLIAEKYSSTNWFNINLNTAIIRYNRSGFDNTKPIKASFSVSNIKKLQIVIDLKSGLFKNKNRINILVIEKNPTPVLLHGLIDEIWNNPKYHFLLKTELKSTEEEIITLRDGEKIFTILKGLPVLRNVIIEKVILD